MKISKKSEKLQFKNNSHNVQNDLSRILISYHSTGTSCLTLIPLTWRIWWAPNNTSRWQMGFNLAFKGLRNRKTTNCETQGLKNLHIYWIQTPLHNKRRSYWELQYTLHTMETWERHTCRTLTDLPYTVAKNTIQVICTTTTKVPNCGFFSTIYQILTVVDDICTRGCFGLLPSYVLIHNTLPFGDKLGPRIQACFFQSCRNIMTIICTVIKLRLTWN